MIKLDNFSEVGFYITWKLIDIGFKGSDVFQNELSAKDIIDFAISIVSDEQDIDENIVDLACEYNNNDDKVDFYVKKLARKEISEYSLEYRKWRILYVMHHLPKAEIEYINGLIELGDIWAKFNFPSDSPHVFQGRDNSITPEHYYTQDNFNDLLRRHNEWIDLEVSQIKASDLKT